MRGVPRILRLTPEPAIALGERAEGQFGDEHRAGCIETLNDRGVVVEVLILEAACAPGSWIAFDCEEILATPRQSVQSDFNQLADAVAQRLRDSGVGLQASERG